MVYNDRRDGKQTDLLSDVSDLDAVHHLLADLHDGLVGRVTRFRHLADLGDTLGPEGTMLFGGSAVLKAWMEARSSFVLGNFTATILLCQSLVENLLAAFLHAAPIGNDLPHRIAFRDTLKRCHARGLISNRDFGDLERLINLRNPLSHFRTVEDDQNLDRRALSVGNSSGELLEHDAWFAIGIAFRILAKPQYRLG